MSASVTLVPDFPRPPAIVAERALAPAKWGMFAFLLSEVAFFSTLVVAYVTFLGHDKVGPTPREVLSLPLAIGGTVCLLASSVTVHLAERSLARGQRQVFLMQWALTIALGAAFLAITAHEWHGLIVEHGLTISRNLFGTTYYTLVGFHALHVTGGVVSMLIVAGLAVGREIAAPQHLGVELIGWYWHFVDAVWIVVFSVVYLAGVLG